MLLRNRAVVLYGQNHRVAEGGREGGREGGKEAGERGREERERKVKLTT